MLVVIIVVVVIIFQIKVLLFRAESCPTTTASHQLSIQHVLPGLVITLQTCKIIIANSSLLVRYVFSVLWDLSYALLPPWCLPHHAS